MKNLHACSLTQNTIIEFRTFLIGLLSDSHVGDDWESTFDKWVRRIEDEIKSNRLKIEEACLVWDHEELRELLKLETCQGYVLSKPRGYDGDFEIIERIYQQWRSPNPALVKWDDYFHAQAAPKAVRNRKHYFLDWLATKEKTVGGRGLLVLNIASGPGRDMFEHFTAHPQSPTRFECVEQDAEAIIYAQKLCLAFIDKLCFHQANAVSFRSRKHYDLVWSGGFFDYLTDDLFSRVLHRYYLMVAAGGELVVGNFSTINPTRTLMELGRWFLHHRTEEQLIGLAVQAGIAPNLIRIAKESEGVNLFLHVQKPQ